MEGRPLELEPLTEEEREWLLDGLKTLIRRQGFEPFVASRILRATNEDFPDAVPKGPPGARVLMRRLLLYARMPEHRPRLQIYSERTFAELDEHGLGHAGPGTAAWFAGIEGDVCHFGVNARELGDQEELIGTLGHEVAHAYRHLHDLRVRDSEVEERLTDLTAVYLGFGIFLLNSSAVFKTGGYSASGERYLYQTQERGYLSPRQIALLLAAQVVARDLDRKRRAAVAAELAPNHRKLFEDACDLLPAPSELRNRLGVPEPSSWPPADPAETAVVPLEPDDEPEDDVAAIVEEPASKAATAQRNESTHAGLFAVSGALLCLGLGAFGVLEGWPLLGGSFVAATLGFLVGGSLATDTCSGCRARLPRALSRCPACSATIVETKADRNEDEDEDEDEGPHDEPGDAEIAVAQEREYRLTVAMYAAWLIDRGLVSPEAEERHAELIVAVRCGERPTERLAQAWNDLTAELPEPPATFLDDYFTRRNGGAKTDFQHLAEAGTLNDTPKAYQRIAVLLDSRLDDWQQKRANGA